MNIINKYVYTGNEKVIFLKIINGVFDQKDWFLIEAEHWKNWS